MSFAKSAFLSRPIFYLHKKFHTMRSFLLNFSTNANTNFNEVVFSDGPHRVRSPYAILREDCIAIFSQISGQLSLTLKHMLSTKWSYILKNPAALSCRFI